MYKIDIQILLVDRPLGNPWYRREDNTVLRRISGALEFKIHTVFGCEFLGGKLEMSEFLEFKTHLNCSTGENI
jgi:hypothetical protein